MGCDMPAFVLGYPRAVHETTAPSPTEIEVALKIANDTSTLPPAEITIVPPAVTMTS